MIKFNDWTITSPGQVLARQRDCRCRELRVIGDLPDGYVWDLLVAVGSAMDVIRLSPVPGGVGVVLTAEQLSIAGLYKMQLRGTMGDVVKHTNIVQTTVSPSLTGDSHWPEIPSEFTQTEQRVLELYQHPPIPGSNGYWLVWDCDADEYVESQLPLPEATTGGTSDHDKLKNRDAADQHPMSAITGLGQALAGKQPVGNYLTEEQDPTVPGWAKQPQKPAYTAQEVGALPATTHIPSTAAEVNAEPSGAVAQHNVSDVAHNDIRLLIQGLSDRLSALADSDDTTLDQLSEIVAYIKSNRNLISSVTTSKVNVSDIVDNLTTNAANKPLSAAQGVTLKALIDALTEAMPEAYTLPVAGPATLGGVMPVAKTDEMTQSVGVDDAGGLWAPAASGGGGGSAFQKIIDFTTEEAVTEFSTPTLTKEQADAIASASVLNIVLDIPRDKSDETISTVGTVDLYYYSAWLSKFVNKISAIPAPATTYSNFKVSMFTVLKNPKAIAGLSAQPCAIIASGYVHNMNTPTPSLSSLGESFLLGSEKSYFKVSGSQTMAAGTRFIVEVVA